MLTGQDAGTTGNAALGMVRHACYADDAEITQVGLIAVIGATCNIDFDVIMTGKNNRFNFPR